MQQIDTYKITWRPCDNAGQIHLGLADGTGSSIPVDSAEEMRMLVDILRNECPVYWDAKHTMLMTGYEPVGEGENDADARKAS
jgi:hypothetical protein